MMFIMLQLLTVHFIADFLLQSDWMALNKSKWNQTSDGLAALTAHAVIYAACFGVFGRLDFVLLTLVTHWMTDASTSKLTSKLWFIDFYPRPDINSYGAYPMFARLTETRHWFFVAIGFDQLIHAWTLVLTYEYLFWTLR